ncbi:MAG: SufE family protein [Acidobacteriota bacterium]
MSAAELPAGLRDTLDGLALVDDRTLRIDLLIETADRFTPVAPSIAVTPYHDDHKVPACESDAYVWALPRPDGTLDFHFAVENPQGISAMALAVVLGESCSGAPLAQVAALPGDVVYDLFGRELSMGKSMGLMGMVSMVAHFARRRVDGAADGEVATPGG